MQIDQSLVRFLFTYDETIPAAIRWRNPHKKATQVRVGDIAGHNHPERAGSSTIRRYVSIRKQRFLVSHIVWLYHKDEPIPHPLGHANGDLTDCRIENLQHSPRPKKPEEHYRSLSAKGYKKWRDAFDAAGWTDYIRKRNLKKAYNLTPEQWQTMHDAQNGRCAICKRPETLIRRGKLEYLAVDHCHANNVVRGLLCAQCNNGLGRFMDSPELLRAAADYIEHHATRLL